MFENIQEVFTKREDFKNKKENVGTTRVSFCAKEMECFS